MAKVEKSRSQSQLKRSRLANLSKLAYWRALPQPNRKVTLSLLLDESEIPGTGWQLAVQQAMKLSAINKNDPINVRAGEIKSTGARRMFNNGLTSESVTIEVSPLATAEDAETRVSMLEERHFSRLTEIINVNEYEVVEYAEWRGGSRIKCIEYSWSVQGSVRTARSAATALGRFFVYANYTTFENPWTWSEVVGLIQLQTKKIRALTETLS